MLIRIAGVYRKIDDHLFELGTIDLDVCRDVFVRKVESDLFAQQILEQSPHVCDGSVRIEDGRIQYLFAAERQQLVGEISGAFGCLADACGGFFGNGMGGIQQFHLAKHDSQIVVEVMGDAAC